VKSCNCFTDLISNIVAAEQWIKQNQKHPAESIAQRLAEARANNSVIDLSAQSDSDAEPPSPPRGASGLGSGKARVGFAGMVRSKRSQLIHTIFVEGPAVEIAREGRPALEDFDEGGDIDLPGSVSYRVQETRRHKMPSFEE